MEVVSLMDLSFLTREEQAIIKNVLKRDTNLKKCDEKRIRKIRKRCLDKKCLKLQTGEWFEDLKAHRFLDFSSAADLLKCVFKQNTHSESPSRKMSCLSKIKNLKLSEIIFSNTTDTLELKRGCPTEVEKNIDVKDEGATSPSPDEEMSVTQILKDLEFILDLEIQNINSSGEITAINGFSPENLMVDKKLPVDYSSHQVWHYPGLQSVEVLQENLSPIMNINNDAGTILAANWYDCHNEESIQYAYPCHMQISQALDHGSTFISSSELDKPFSSSPCLSSQFLFPENCFRCDFEMSSEKNCKLEQYQPSRDEEFSCETSLETESTIVESTILEVN
ncbi:uncharacterized protein LOC134911569 isoform X2 [Pseudophryne corroboree]|uniref:uncharacterized protein LOC134911569 isoform X2 n=1 Tax=Pseudophryne corroboree TaxID=495146 RepID=UPI003081358C